MSIIKVGDINPTLKNVFISPKLFTSLISVGQLVENNCDVYLTRNGCLVQDQVFGTMIVKGLKVKILFLLHFSIPRFVSFACTTIQNKDEVCHKHLGHQSFIVLSRWLNSGFLENKDQFSSHDVLFDCSIFKLDKSKTLPFTFLCQQKVINYALLIVVSLGCIYSHKQKMRFSLSCITF